MTYANARKLHNEDEVILKKTGACLRVLDVSCPRPMNMIQRKEVFIKCDDGNTYHHTEII